MKKIFTKLLIISIVLAIISLALCLFSLKGNSFNFSATEEIIDEVNEMGSDNPGAGWYLLFAGGTATMVDFAMVFINVSLVLLIPSVILLMIVILQVISRLVQIGEEKNWKNITSKVCTYISMFLQVILTFVYTFNLLTNLNFNRVLVGIALVLNLVNIILFIKEVLKIKKLVVEKF